MEYDNPIHVKCITKIGLTHKTKVNVVTWT